MKKFYTLLAIVSLITVHAQVSLTSFGSTEPGATLFGGRIAASENDIVCSVITPENIWKVQFLKKEGTQMLENGTFESPDTGNIGAYGFSIAISGNYAAVSAPYLGGMGAVYLYKKDNETWTYIQTITAFDGQLNDNFGVMVKLYNDQLFVRAIGYEDDGQSPDANNGAIYIYNISGDATTFSQKLSFTDKNNFGSYIHINDNKMVVRINYVVSGDSAIETFVLSNGTWVSDSTFQPNSTGHGVMKLKDGKLYVAQGYGTELLSTTKIMSYEMADGEWAEESSFIIDDIIFGDNRLTDFDIYGDTIICGLAGYIQLTERKSPCAVYKKDAGTWSLVQTIYSEGDAGSDDRFGLNVVILDDLILISANSEGVLNQGKIYYSDQTLNLGEFAFNSTIYPNPTTGILFISDTNQSIEKAQIFALTGELLDTQSHYPSQLSLENFAAGMYFIKLTSSQRLNQTFKIVKY